MGKYIFRNNNYLIPAGAFRKTRNNPDFVFFSGIIERQRGWML
jgi:hypothetical protein